MGLVRSGAFTLRYKVIRGIVSLRLNDTAVR